jgi:hypothetical protein
MFVGAPRLRATIVAEVSFAAMGTGFITAAWFTIRFGAVPAVPAIFMTTP